VAKGDIILVYSVHIQCGSGIDFSNKTVARPSGTSDNKQTNNTRVFSVSYV
jgi:hypothetical protein